MTNQSPIEDGAFQTTRWTLVARAGGLSVTQRGPALSELLRCYLPAMRSHLVRRQRIAPERADDLLQGFIVRKILEYDLIARADQARGKFRTLLLTSLDNFVRNELGRPARESGQELPEALPDDGLEPGADFDVPWAQALLGQAIERMRAECEREGRTDVWGVFDARILGPTLRDEPTMEYAQLVERFGLKSPAQASNVLITAKRMFERTLRSVVAEYADESAIDEEINDLRIVLSRAQ
ncbi:MAG: sigma-70 family RNA polymerase sigma factor [Anaerolineae bacterium]|nr:sigma-70 family RNA polymerase sigma factor [Phycisphaerae bacterium]